VSCLLNLKVWLISCAMLLGLAQPAAANPFDEAVAAYRAGDLVSSAALFEGLLDDVESRTARGPIFYNLGNIHFRQGEFMRAVAAYTAAVEAMPRSQTAWDNLELARSRAGLDPADKGDFAATVKRLVMVLSPAELAWIGWGLIGLLAIGLLVEMLRGGPGLRALIGVVLVLIAFDLAWMDVASARLSAGSRCTPSPTLTTRWASRSRRASASAWWIAWVRPACAAHGSKWPAKKAPAGSRTAIL
jgi:tetratricopeptide (TPR) repeat protein